MLINADDFEAIRAGHVDTVFRRWIRPTVKAGGTLTTSAGVLAIEAVDVVALNAVEQQDISRAGFADREDLDAMLGDKGTLYRIRLRYVGEDPRVALSESAVLADADALAETIARIDGGSPWVQTTLALIAERPGQAAQELAAILGSQPVKFKSNVRRLKSLGLTESLSVGYKLSPRGQAWLDRITASA